MSTSEAAAAAERLRTAERLANNPNPTDPQFRAKAAVVKYWNDGLVEGGGGLLKIDDLYVVSFKYILGYWKALVSSDAWDDTSYFEVTYNPDKEEMYVDHYRKVRNVCFPDDSDFKMAKLRQRLS